MTRCKPGELAVVVRADNASNLGLIVRVVSLQDRSGDIVFPEARGVVWFVNCEQPMTYKLHCQFLTRTQGPLPNSQLQPISNLLQRPSTADRTGGPTPRPYAD